MLRQRHTQRKNPENLNIARLCNVSRDCSENAEIFNIFFGWHIGTFLAPFKTYKNMYFSCLLCIFLLFSKKKFQDFFAQILYCTFYSKMPIFSKISSNFCITFPNKWLIQWPFLMDNFHFYNFSLKIWIWFKFGSIWDRVWHETSILAKRKQKRVAALKRVF